MERVGSKCHTKKSSIFDFITYTVHMFKNATFFTKSHEMSRSYITFMQKEYFFITALFRKAYSIKILVSGFAFVSTDVRILKLAYMHKYDYQVDSETINSGCFVIRSKVLYVCLPRRLTVSEMAKTRQFLHHLFWFSLPFWPASRSTIFEESQRSRKFPP